MKDNECDKHVASGNVVNPCYLWIPYLQIHTLAKIHPECPYQINTCSALVLICGHAQMCTEWQKVWVVQHACFQLRLNKAIFCFLVSALILETSVLSTIYLACAFYMVLLFVVLNAPQVQCWSESSVSKYKKAVRRFQRKYVLNTLCPGMSCSAGSHAFNVNESILHHK